MQMPVTAPTRRSARTLLALLLRLQQQQAQPASSSYPSCCNHKTHSQITASIAATPVALAAAPRRQRECFPNVLMRPGPWRHLLEQRQLPSLLQRPLLLLRCLPATRGPA